MAKVGDVLLQPEEGWKRFDDFDPLIQYLGIKWNSSITSTKGDYKDTVHWANSDFSAGTNAVVFSFYGTGFRVIGMLRSNVFSSYNNPINVEIDGVLVGSYSLKSSSSDNVYQTIMYEKVGLTEGVHKVKIYATDITFDAVDILGGELVTTSLVGIPLPNPETGWSRIDNNYFLFKYNGTWQFGENVEWHNKTYAYAKDNNSSVEFKFYGTKLRIISIYDTQQYRSSDIKITIDSITETYSEVSDKLTPKVLAYERTNLPLGVHTVKIESGSSGTYSLNFDCIDIDENGAVMDLDEVLTVKELAVGKKIRCKYDYTTMSFFDLGKMGGNTFLSGGAFSSDASSSSKYFYFIMVEDKNGIKKLIADRNVHYSISFNTLLSKDFTSKSGKPIIFDNQPNNLKFSIGLPSGGTLSYDTLTNDWDKFISGKSNDTWNWKDATTITSSMTSYDNSSNWGIARGKVSSDNYTFLNLDSVDTTYGFRPMLLIEFPIGTNVNRFLIEFNGEILSKLNNYKNVGRLDDNNNPTMKQLLDFGMKDVNQLFEFTNKGYSNFISTESLDGKVSESNSINKADIFTTIDLDGNNIQWDLMNYYKPLDILPDEFNVILYNGILDAVEEDTTIKKYLLKSGDSLYSLNPSKYNSDVTSLIKIENAELSEQLFNDEGGNDLSVLKNLTLIKGLTDSTFKIVRYTK